MADEDLQADWRNTDKQGSSRQEASAGISQDSAPPSSEDSPSTARRPSPESSRNDAKGKRYKRFSLPRKNSFRKSKKSISAENSSDTNSENKERCSLTPMHKRSLRERRSSLRAVEQCIKSCFPEHSEDVPEELVFGRGPAAKGGERSGNTGGPRSTNFPRASSLPNHEEDFPEEASFDLAGKIKPRSTSWLGCFDQPHGVVNAAKDVEQKIFASRDSWYSDRRLLALSSELDKSDTTKDYKEPEERATERASNFTRTSWVRQQEQDMYSKASKTLRHSWRKDEVATREISSSDYEEQREDASKTSNFVSPSVRSIIAEQKGKEIHQLPSFPTLILEGKELPSAFFWKFQEYAQQETLFRSPEELETDKEKPFWMDRIHTACADRWLENAKILDNSCVSVVHTGFCYSSQMEERREQLTAEEFLSCLALIARLRKMTLSEAVALLIECPSPEQRAHLSRLSTDSTSLTRRFTMFFDKLVRRGSR